MAVILGMQICSTLQTALPLSGICHAFRPHALDPHTSETCTPLYLAKPTHWAQDGDFFRFRNRTARYKLQQQLTCLAVVGSPVFPESQQRCSPGPSVRPRCTACFQADKCHREYVRVVHTRKAVCRAASLSCRVATALHGPIQPSNRIPRRTGVCGRTEN